MQLVCQLQETVIYRSAVEAGMLTVVSPKELMRHLRTISNA